MILRKANLKKKEYKLIGEATIINEGEFLLCFHQFILIDIVN